MQPPSPASRWVTFAEATAILRTTEPTLRRWIRLGRVTAEALPRDPQSPASARVTYRVLVPDDPSPAATTPDEGEPPPPATDPPPDLAAAIAAATAPWVERVAALDERNERQVALVVEQAQRIGRLQAEAEALRQQLEAATARRPWYRLWW